MARGEGAPARRWFLKALGAGALAPVLGAGVLVNGWVLTAAALDALGLHAG